MENKRIPWGYAVNDCADNFVDDLVYRLPISIEQHVEQIRILIWLIILRSKLNYFARQRN